MKTAQTNVNWLNLSTEMLFQLSYGDLALNRVGKSGLSIRFFFPKFVRVIN